MCKKKRDLNTYWLFVDRYADEHCSSLGGSLVVPRNEKENLEVVDIAEDYYQVRKTPFKIYII